MENIINKKDEERLRNRIEQSHRAVARDVLDLLKAEINADLAKVIEANSGKSVESLAYGYLRSISIINQYIDVLNKE